MTGLTIPVRVTDVRIAFGRVDVLVTPIGGSGERWVNADKLITGSDDD